MTKWHFMTLNISTFDALSLKRWSAPSTLYKLCVIQKQPPNIYLINYRPEGGKIFSLS